MNEQEVRDMLNDVMGLLVDDPETCAHIRRKCSKRGVKGLMSMRQLRDVPADRRGRKKHAFGS